MTGINQAHFACFDLDLKRLVRRLVAEDGFKSSIEAEEAIEGYKLFLANAISSSPKKSFVTSPAVDKIWQRHLLDTRIYQDDCNSLLQLAGKAKGYIHRRLSSEDEGLFYLYISDSSSDIPSINNSRIEAKISSLAEEDLSYLVERVQRALAQKVLEQFSPKPWIVDGLHLVTKHPKRCLIEYCRFLELYLNRGPSQKGRLTPSKLVLHPNKP